MGNVSKKRNMAKAHNKIEVVYSKRLSEGYDFNQQAVNDELKQMDGSEFHFLQNLGPEWSVQQEVDSFIIKNTKAPTRQMIVSLAKNLPEFKDDDKNEKYPYAYILQGLGKEQFDPRKSGHQGYYTIEKSRTSSVEALFNRGQAPYVHWFN